MILGNLASIFQLSAGAALAMSVFRAPYEQAYQRLGAILDCEEALLSGRSGLQIATQAQKIQEVRAEWHIAGAGLRTEIAKWELLAWIGVAINLVLLAAASLWSEFNLTRSAGGVLLVVALGPFAFAAVKIGSAVDRWLRPVALAAKTL